MHLIIAKFSGFSRFTDTHGLSLSIEDNQHYLVVDAFVLSNHRHFRNWLGTLQYWPIKEGNSKNV